MAPGSVSGVATSDTDSLYVWQIRDQTGSTVADREQKAGQRIRKGMPKRLPPPLIYAMHIRQALYQIQYYLFSHCLFYFTGALKCLV